MHKNIISVKKQQHLPTTGDIISRLPGVIGCPPGVPGKYAELGVIGGGPPGVEGK